jgi:hypothetical protein
LTWNANPAGDNITNYNVYFGNASGTYNGAGSPVDVGNVTAYSLPHAGLSNPVFIAITAENAAGESAFSGEISHTH